MKRSWSLWRTILLIGGVAVASARATPIVESTSFDETIVTGTITFETTGGLVISTLQYTGWSDEIPSDIEMDLINEPPNSPVYASDISRILASAPQVVLTDDLDFLTMQLPNVYVPSSGPTLIGEPSNVSELAGLYPGFEVVSTTVQTVAVASYSTGAYESSDTIIDGTVTFDMYEEDYVEQQVSAAPEAASYLYPIGGCSALLMAACRRATRGSR